MLYEEILTIICGWNVINIYDNIYTCNNLQEINTNLPIIEKAMNIIERLENLKQVEKDVYIEIIGYQQEKIDILEKENNKLKEFINKNSGEIFTKGKEVKGITKKLTIEEVNMLSLLK